jgi:hypothetical protein
VEQAPSKRQSGKNAFIADSLPGIGACHETPVRHKALFALPARTGGTMTRFSQIPSMPAISFTLDGKDISCELARKVTTDVHVDQVSAVNRKFFGLFSGFVVCFFVIAGHPYISFFAVNSVF